MNARPKNLFEVAKVEAPLPADAATPLQADATAVIGAESAPNWRPDRDDFDWSPVNNESIVVKAQPAIAVFWNPHGDVCIRQESRLHPDEDHFVTIRPEYLAPLIAALIECQDGPGDLVR